MSVGTCFPYLLTLIFLFQLRTIAPVLIFRVPQMEDGKLSEGTVAEELPQACINNNTIVYLLFF